MGKLVAYTGYEPPPDLEKAHQRETGFPCRGRRPREFRPLHDSGGTNDEGKREAKKLFESKYHVASFDWSPDSKSVAFEHWPTPLADDWTKADIAEVEVVTGHVTDIAKTSAAESSPHYSPDGRYLAFDKTSEPVHWPGDAHIALLNRASGAVRLLPDTFDGKPALLGWAADSKSLVFLESKGTRSELFSMPIDGPAQSLYLPEKGVVGGGAALNVSGTHIGFSHESSADAPEAYFMALEGGGQPVRISRANDDLASRLLGKQR